MGGGGGGWEIRISLLLFQTPHCEGWILREWTIEPTLNAEHASTLKCFKKEGTQSYNGPLGGDGPGVRVSLFLLQKGKQKKIEKYVVLHKRWGEGGGKGFVSWAPQLS